MLYEMQLEYSRIHTKNQPHEILGIGIKLEEKLEGNIALQK